MNPLLSAVDAALLAFVWQGVVVAALQWIALALLAKRTARARYLGSCAALGLLAVLPVVTAWSAYARQAAADDAPLKVITLAAYAPGARVVIDWWAVAQQWLAPAWACGVLLFSIRMLWGCVKMSRLKREGDEADPALLAMVERTARRIRVSRPVRVLISSLADGPSVVGALRPVVLLPAVALLGLKEEQLEAVLAHELAHIRRYDYLVNLLQMLIETLFFYHPAVWWISRRIRVERELCCDDIAVAACGDAVCYARALTTLEKMRVASPRFGLGAKDGPLLYRIERLLGVAEWQPGSSRMPGLVAICLVLLCLTPMLHPVKAQSPPAALPATPAPAPRAQATSRSTSRSGSPDVVTVEVTVDSKGDVADARVVNGPLGLRRQALEAALSMTFPTDTAVTRRLTVPISTQKLEAARQPKAEETTEFLRKQLSELQQAGDESRMHLQQIQDQIQLLERELESSEEVQRLLEQSQRNAAGSQSVR